MTNLSIGARRAGLLRKQEVYDVLLGTQVVATFHDLGDAGNYVSMRENQTYYAHRESVMRDLVAVLRAAPELVINEAEYRQKGLGYVVEFYGRQRRWLQDRAALLKEKT
jgi:hypothetical protein